MVIALNDCLGLDWLTGISSSYSYCVIQCFDTVDVDFVLYLAKYLYFLRVESIFIYLISVRKMSS